MIRCYLFTIKKDFKEELIYLNSIFKESSILESTMFEPNLIEFQLFLSNDLDKSNDIKVFIFLIS